jgi:hypothetical protein
MELASTWYECGVSGSLFSCSSLGSDGICSEAAPGAGKVFSACITHRQRISSLNPGLGPHAVVDMVSSNIHMNQDKAREPIDRGGVRENAPASCTHRRAGSAKEPRSEGCYGGVGQATSEAKLGHC